MLSALAVSWVMKKWRRDKSEHPLMLELPSYRMPHPRDLLLGLWERTMIFLRRVGGLPPAQLAQLLVRREAEIVREAVVCAGGRSEEASLDQLLPLVSHPDWSVRAEAIQVLADRRVTKAVPTILRRLEGEQDGFVRDAILRALERLEG